MSEQQNNNKKKVVDETPRFRPLEKELPPDAHAIGREDITLQNYKQKMAEEQPDRNKAAIVKKRDEEEEEDNPELANKIHASMDSTVDPEILEANQIRNRRMRELAKHEVAVIPYFIYKPIEGKTWVNPLTGEEEQEYEKGEGTWEPRRFYRYKITKKDFDFAERERLKNSEKYKDQPAKLKEMDERYTAFLAKKFFDMNMEDMDDADYSVLKDYVASSIYRTVVGLPSSQKQSSSSLTANNPVR